MTKTESHCTIVNNGSRDTDAAVLALLSERVNNNPLPIFSMRYFTNGHVKQVGFEKQSIWHGVIFLGVRHQAGVNVRGNTHTQTNFPIISYLFLPLHSFSTASEDSNFLSAQNFTSIATRVCLYVRVCVFPDINVGNVRTNAAREWNEMRCERMCSGRACSSQVGGQRMYQSLIIFTHARACAQTHSALSSVPSVYLSLW